MESILKSILGEQNIYLDISKKTIEEQVKYITSIIHNNKVYLYAIDTELNSFYNYHNHRFIIFHKDNYVSLYNTTDVINSRILLKKSLDNSNNFECVICYEEINNKCYSCMQCGSSICHSCLMKVNKKDFNKCSICRQKMIENIKIKV